ncbi:hypothetical protein M8J77_018450, partial [Diaphorina citri]
AAVQEGNNSCRIRVRDNITGLLFLVDTGADISLVPPCPAERGNKQPLELNSGTTQSSLG